MNLRKIKSVYNPKQELIKQTDQKHQGHKKVTSTITGLLDQSKVSELDNTRQRLFSNINQISKLNRKHSSSRSFQQSKSKSKSKSKHRSKSKKQLLQDTYKKLIFVNHEQQQKTQYSQTNKKLNKLQSMLKDIKQCHTKSIIPVYVIHDNELKNRRFNNKKSNKFQSQEIEYFRNQIVEIRKQLQKMRQTNQLIISKSQFNETDQSHITSKTQQRQKVFMRKDEQKSKSKSIKSKQTYMIPYFKQQTLPQQILHRTIIHSRSLNHINLYPLNKSISHQKIFPCHACGCTCHVQKKIYYA